MARTKLTLSEVVPLGVLARSDDGGWLHTLCLKSGAMRQQIIFAAHSGKKGRAYRSPAVTISTPRRVVAWGYADKISGLLCVYVHPYWRKKGLGSMIVRKLKKHARYCLPWSTAGKRLYTKCGIPFGRVEGFCSI